MALFKGSTGFVTLNSITACEIADWKCSIEYERPDVTPLYDSVNKHTALGLTSGSGSVKSYVWLGTTSANFTITLKADSGRNITGTAQLTKTDINTPSDGFLTYDYNFVFTGAITIT